MAYRQYFPAISVADGGRPYSIAEFATEKYERPPSDESTGAYADLELGEPRSRSREGRGVHQSGRWEGLSTDTEEDTSRPPIIKIQDAEYEYPSTSDQRNPENRPL